MRKIRDWTIRWGVMGLLLAIPIRVAAYDLIVVGDTNLFPFDTANAGDIGNMVDCYNGLTACPPGCNQNLFPFDTCNAGDIGFMVDYLNGGALSFFPGSGYIDFTPDPANPAGGNGTYGVIVDMVSTSSNLSGFDNIKGVLGIRAEIFSDTGGGASITPPAAALVASGPGLQVGTGSRAQGTASVDLTCGASGDVTIRYYVPAYAGVIASGEHCAGGAACAPGEHFDQIDIVVTCGNECSGQPDGTACTDDGNACTDDECQTEICVHPNKTDGTACGDPTNDDCTNPDTCLTGTCQDNHESDGFACTDDGNDCTDDQCLTGACDHPDKVDGTACGDPTNGDCTNPDTCLTGTCQDNHESDGFACTDDGNDCTDDQCLTGACDHPNKSDGTACGDPTNDDCTNPDTCTTGACQDNHEIDGTACTDDGNDCTNDQCLTGACDHPNKSDGTLCTDDLLFCTGVEDCLTGVCTSPGDPCTPVVESCNEGTDTCDPVASCEGDTGTALSPTYLPDTGKWTNLGSADSVCVVYDESLNKSATEATCVAFSCVVSTTTNSNDTLCLTPPAGVCGDSGTFSWTAESCDSAGDTHAGSFGYRLSDDIETPPNVNARGGVGDGYLNGTIDVCVVDAQTGASLTVDAFVMLTSGTIGNTYQMGTNYEATISAGNDCVTMSDAAILGPLSITAAADGYKVVTLADIDARTAVVPMEKRLPAVQGQADAGGTLFELTGSIDLASLDAGIHPVGVGYTAPNVAGDPGRHGACQDNMNPNPTRGVLALLGMKNRNLATLGFDDLMASDRLKSFAVCDSGYDETPPGGAFLDRNAPDNLIFPDINYLGDEDIFGGLLTTETSNVVVQVLGLSISPEKADVTDILNADFTQFDIYVTTQDMAIVSPDAVKCPTGVCDLNNTADFPNAGVFNLDPASGALDYGYDFSATCAAGHGSQAAGNCYWEKHKLDWNLEVEFLFPGVQTDALNNSLFEGDPPGSPDHATDRPTDPDQPRYGPYCDGVNCYAENEYEGFLLRDPDEVGGDPYRGKIGNRADGMFLFGLEVVAGALADQFLLMNISLGGDIHCPSGNGTGNGCDVWMPLGSPTKSAIETYLNAQQASSATTTRFNSMSTWFKIEPRVSGYIIDDATVNAGPNPINATDRSGSYVIHAWGPDDLLGLPTGLIPYDPGASADPAHCLDSVSTQYCRFCVGGDEPGMACVNHADCPGGGATCVAVSDITDFELATRQFSFISRGPNGVSGSFDRDIKFTRNDLALPANCLDTSDQLIITSTGNLECGDDYWSVYANGPDSAGGKVDFTLPDITGLGSLPDWRYVLGAGPGQLDAGFAETINHVRKTCVGGTNAGAGCDFDSTVCTGGGVCTSSGYTQMEWSQLALGGSSLESCATINNWRFSEKPAGGDGGLLDSDFFSRNVQNILYKD